MRGGLGEKGVDEASKQACMQAKDATERRAEPKQKAKSKKQNDAQ